MIVICTKCQAKFRVADDKIGPRGAKVRCSKCQTVFLVHAVLGTVPVTDGEARHDRTRTPAESSPAPAPAPDAGGLPAPEPDPFAGREPFPPPAAGAFAAPQDPFAAAAPPPSPDPFAGADPFAAPAGGAGDAGAPASLGDPFVAAVAPRPSLPVTDLSDLLGGPPAAAAPPAPPPLPAAAEQPAFPPAPPLEDPFAAAAPPPLPFGTDDPFAHPGAPPPAAPPEPDLEAATPAAAASLDPGGLSLEDRLTPPPAPLAPAAHGAALDQTLETAAPGDPFAAFAAAPAGAAPEPFDAGAFDFSGGEPLGVPEEPALAAEPQAAAPVPPPARPPSPAPAAAPAAPAAARAAAPEPTDRIPGARTSRLRAVAVNAVALFALLVVALAIWAVWRTDGPVDAASLRPSAILAALRRGSSSGPWKVQDVRSGVYDRARGAPLLFVRGRVVSRAPAPVAAVNVAVEVVRGSRVLARGEALAGAVPTAEELYLATDDAAVEAATSVARSRAPAVVRPGDVVPFLVAVGDAPPDLDGASLRIAAAPAPAAAPPHGGAAP